MLTINHGIWFSPEEKTPDYTVRVLVMYEDGRIEKCRFSYSDLPNRSEFTDSWGDHLNYDDFKYWSYLDDHFEL